MTGLTVLDIFEVLSCMHLNLFLICCKYVYWWQCIWLKFWNLLGFDLLIDDSGKCNFKVVPYHAYAFNMLQDNASSLKAQLDQQKGVVDNLVSNTRVSQSYSLPVHLNTEMISVRKLCFWITGLNSCADSFCMEWHHDFGLVLIIRWLYIHKSLLDCCYMLVY